MPEPHHSSSSSRASVKPGYKTTEGVAAAIAIAYSIISAIAGNLPERYAAIATAVAAGLYALGRGLAKAGK